MTKRQLSDMDPITPQPRAHSSVSEYVTLQSEYPTALSTPAAAPTCSSFATNSSTARRRFS